MNSTAPPLPTPSGFWVRGLGLDPQVGSVSGSGGESNHVAFVTREKVFITDAAMGVLPTLKVH